MNVKFWHSTKNKQKKRIWFNKKETFLRKFLFSLSLSLNPVHVYILLGFMGFRIIKLNVLFFPIISFLFHFIDFIIINDNQGLNLLLLFFFGSSFFLGSSFLTDFMTKINKIEMIDQENKKFFIYKPRYTQIYLRWLEW